MKRWLPYLVLMMIAWPVGLKVDAKVEAKAPVFVGGPGQYSVLFNGPAMKVICMGFDTATADYLFMKLIQYFAYHDDHDTPMPNILPMVETMTDIDPRFTYAYQFAWTAIMDFDVRSWEERIREGGYILRKGWRNNPDSWRIAQDLAFHNFFYEGDFEKAANMYDMAFKLRGEFPLYAQLAARLRTNAGKPELALMALQQQYEEAQNDDHRRVLQYQMNQVRTEITARKLEEAVEKFRLETGRFPNSLAELVPRYISKIPKDDFGGKFFWNKERERVESTSLTNGRMEVFFDKSYMPPWKR